jgi:CRP/FNR family transcriptional regulator
MRLPEALLNKLLPSASVRRVGLNEQVLLEGHVPENFFVVKKGSLRAYSMTPHGRQMEIARFGEGEIVAAALVFHGGAFPHFVEACEVGEVFAINRKRAWGLITSDQELSSFFLELLSDKCHILHTRLNALQLQTVRERLLYMLAEFCPKGGECSIHLPSSKKELAVQLGTTPETLSRTLGQLEEEGVLRVEGRTIMMLQCHRMPC